MDGAVTPFTRLPATAAQMLAVETLLAEPEALGDDVLETCLYLLRQRLHESAGRPGDHPSADTPGKDPTNANHGEDHEH
jgi:hypothetical protein